MAYTPVRLYIGQPGVAETTIVSAITGGRILKQLVLCNTSTAAASISLSLVPSGASPVVANRLLHLLSVPALGVTTLDMSQVMVAGDALVALQATAGAITMTLSGVSF